MSAQSVDLTLAELERALDHAKAEYVFADYIDNTQRRDFERDRLSKRRQQLRDQVAAARAKQGASV